MKKQFLHFSIGLLVITALFVNTAVAQGPIQRVSYDANTLGYGVVNYNTGYSTADYVAAVAGFRAISGEMASNSHTNVDMLFAQMVENNGTWHIQADIRSVNTHETWEVEVLFIDRHLADGDVITGDGEITTIGGTYTNIAGHDLALGTDDGRSKGTYTNQRAMVHGGNDELYINFAGDFEGGTHIQSTLSVQNKLTASGDVQVNGNIGVGTASPDAMLHLYDNVAAGARMLQLGDDVYFTDIDVPNTIGLYGVQNDSTVELRLGNQGATIVGKSDGSVVLKGNVEVQGNLAVTGSIASGTGARSADTEEAMTAMLSELETLQQQNQALAARVATLEDALNIGSEVKPWDGLGTLLAQNYPNPFTEVTTIGYQLPEGAQQATLYVYDMNGRQLLTRTDLAGSSEVEIQGGQLKAGMYYYSLVVNGQVLDTKRMLLTQ